MLTIDMEPNSSENEVVTSYQQIGCVIVKSCDIATLVEISLYSIFVNNRSLSLKTQPTDVPSSIVIQPVKISLNLYLHVTTNVV